MPSELQKISEEQTRIASRAKFWLGLYLVAATVPYVLFDVYSSDPDRAAALFGSVLWGIGYLLFIKLMQVGGYLDHGKETGIGTYLVLGLAVTILVGIGFIALVLPGLYMLMRLLPAYGRALTTRDGVGNSMRWSWRQTQGLQRPLGIAMIGPILCYVVSLGATLAHGQFYYLFDWTGYVLVSILWNGAIAVGTAWFSVFSVASFAMASSVPVGNEALFGG